MVDSYCHKNVGMLVCEKSIIFYHNVKFCVGKLFKIGPVTNFPCLFCIFIDKKTSLIVIKGNQYSSVQSVQILVAVFINLCHKQFVTSMKDFCSHWVPFMSSFIWDCQWKDGHHQNSKGVTVLTVFHLGLLWR